MKYEYRFSNETISIDIFDSDYEVLIELDRIERNVNQRETRRYVSLESLNLDGACSLPPRTWRLPASAALRTKRSGTLWSGCCPNSANSFARFSMKIEQLRALRVRKASARAQSAGVWGGHSRG